MIQRRGINRNVGFQPLGEQLVGHVVFMDADPGSFGPACETADAILDCFLAQMDRLHLSAGVAHSSTRASNSIPVFVIPSIRGLELMAKTFMVVSFSSCDLFVDPASFVSIPLEDSGWYVERA